MFEVWKPGLPCRALFQCVLQARIVDALAWHNKGVLRTEEKLRLLSLAHERRASKNNAFEPRVLSANPIDCVLPILQSPQVDSMHGTEIFESSCEQSLEDSE